MSYSDVYSRSIADKAAFWEECASSIDWHKPFNQVVDESHLPFVKWFVGGETNLCHNAIDRHCADHGDKPALKYISTETGISTTYTFNELRVKVMQMAAILHKMDVQKGDRVLIYMPMIPEAAFAMLACARIGAVHSVVFGGFASHSLAVRIDDAKPKAFITSDAGMRGGKIVPYQELAHEAISISKYPPKHVLWVNRQLDKNFKSTGTTHPNTTITDHDYHELASATGEAEIPVTWLESNEPSYILYTSGTTGKPKGVQRDVGGYAVALATSMNMIYCGEKGRAMLTTSDIGWVVGHSYIVYGPLIAGVTTIMYEGLPTSPDASIWWKIVEENSVQVMFSAPTAIRVLKKYDAEAITKHDLSGLKHLFLAGEPLDEPTASWAQQTIGVPIIDNYWQTETGWPILSVMRGIEPDHATRLGSPGFPIIGYDVKILKEDGTEAGADEKGVVCIKPPLPPGCLTTLWEDDERFLQTYFIDHRGEKYYSTFDYGIRDQDGYYFILGRTDDVINVAGHRLGTREIEEAISSHKEVAECAVVGINDSVKGQAPIAFVVLIDTTKSAAADEAAALQLSISKVVDEYLGAIARPKEIHFVNMLPKTRSGKLIRRSLQALAEGREVGDLSTLENVQSIEHLKQMFNEKHQ